MGLLANMKAFRKCCPFHKEIRGEIILALKKGSAEWYEEMQAQVLSQQHAAALDPHELHKTDKALQALAHLMIVLYVDLQTGLHAFNILFEQ